jgi:hypothetical protein
MMNHILNAFLIIKKMNKNEEQCRYFQKIWIKKFVKPENVVYTQTRTQK